MSAQCTIRDSNFVLSMLHTSKPRRTRASTHLRRPISVSCFRLRQGGYVVPIVCLSVSNFSKKNYTHRIFMKILPEISKDKEKLIKVWKSAASGSGSMNFLKDSSILRDMAFSRNLAHIYGKTNRFFMEILSQMYPWTKKSPRI